MNKSPLAPRLLQLPPKQLVGMSVQMSLAHNQTFALWKSFMPRRKEIAPVVNADLYSIQIYPADYDFQPQTEFTKWAAVEVQELGKIPSEMDVLALTGGLYAVFFYRGSSRDTRIFQQIFFEWLPASPYLLDDRPHFELLGEKYKNNDPNSEEEIWIPVREKG